MHYGRQKLGQNRGKGRRIVTPNKLDLTFQAPNHGAKFHENRSNLKIATVRPTTDTLTDRHSQVIL